MGHSLFPIHHLVHTYMHNSETKGCIGCFTYWTTTLLTEMSIFRVRAVRDVWLVSYGSKPASQPLFNTTFFVYLHSKLKNYRLYMDFLHIEWLLYYRWCLYSVLKLDARYMQLVSYGLKHALQSLSAWTFYTGELQPKKDMHQLFSDTALCTCTASPYLHRYLVCNYTWQQNSRTLWLHTTHQMMAILPMTYRFIIVKSASYTTHCSAYSINRVCEY